MTTKSTRTTLVAGAMSLALGSSLLAVPTATAQEGQNTAPTQCKTVVTGGTFNWGVKQSFRQYIQGFIAKGKWSLEGNVQESDPDNRDGEDFQFKYEVDPASSTVEFDETGKVTKADIRTKPSKITFEGHHGALYTNFLNPFVQTEGGQVKGGAGYLAYYVPGKDMTHYTPEDRTEANKVTGSDVFSSGEGTWTVNEGTVKLDATKMQYVPKRGTDPRAGIIEGVDALFMGLYSSSYKPELDDIDISLTTEKKCENPKPPVKPDPKPGEGSDIGNGSAPEMSSTHWEKFAKVWNYLLGAAGILGMAAILAHALKVSGAFNGINKQIDDFLRKVKLR
ncbi:HtaA domain-containing protein [Corynebacterium auriscanis]|uniref:HtaA domain-containing protein n=1 Tax=Corynebacterium auriscanis TaxID=99807 RepID=UPI003CE8713F